jgi:hypothetical protein
MIFKKGSELLLIRHGKLAASLSLESGESILGDLIQSLRAMGEVVDDDSTILPSGNYEESEKLARIVLEDCEWHQRALRRCGFD